MNHIRDTYRESHGNKPVISIMDLGDCVVGSMDAHDVPKDQKIIAYRYGIHAVSSMRRYLIREFPDHTIRG